MSFIDIITIGTYHPFMMAWLLIKNGGWVIFLIVTLWGLWEMWVYWRQGKHLMAREHCLLAIDVPKNNEQGPHAVENFFAQLAGAHGNRTFYQKYLYGYMQSFFSLEIVSIGGNIQFLIRTEKRFRDLVEAAVYAQYPDAEITEVEDYVYNIPAVFPNNTHRLWGTEFVLANKDYCYPIKTYVDFEHQLSREFTDPMAAFMEVMGNIKPGEQVWYQLTVTPIDHTTWRIPCVNLIKKISGQTPSKKGGFFSDLANEPPYLVREMLDQITGGPKAQNGVKGSSTTDLGVLKLSPGEVDAMKAIQRKISKIAFDVKIRLIYIAPKDTYHTQRVIHPLVGALKQFTELNLNSFKPDLKKTGTRANYFFQKLRIKWRTQKILAAYRNRSNWAGRDPSKLNIEELATIYHFPTIFVKTPTIQQTLSKKFEAPMQIPYEISGGDGRSFVPKKDEASDSSAVLEEGPPPDLPTG